MLVDVVSYTPSKLQSWNLEFQNNQSLITNHSNRIAECRNFLAPLEDNLQRVNQAISEVRLALANLNSEVFLDVLDYLNPRYPVYRHYGQGDHDRNHRIYNLQQQLGDWVRSQKQLVDNMRPYQREVGCLTREVDALTQRNKWLQQHLVPASSFLNTLDTNPRALVMELRDKLLAVVHDYEEQHFIKLPLSVRSCLFAIHEGLKFLVIDIRDIRTQRQNYLRLCGALDHMYSRVHSENKDDNFLNTLAEVINTTHVNPQEDLFDDLEINYSAASWFEAVKKHHSHMFDISESALYREEVVRCQRIMSELLEPSLSDDTYLRQIIRQAASSIDVELCEKLRRNERIDYHFYTHMANTLMQLHLNPAEQRAAERLFHMAEHATGASSLSKKVLGSLMLVLGCLMVGASVFAFFSTMGSSSALSTWGGALGLSLIQTQTALGMSCSITAAVGAGISFWGMRTVSASRRQGLSLELVAAYEVASAEMEQAVLLPSYN